MSNIDINNLTPEQLATILLQADTTTRKAATKIVEDTLSVSYVESHGKIWETKVYIQGGSQGKKGASVRVQFLKDLLSDVDTFQQLDSLCNFDKEALSELANAVNQSNPLKV